jgi:DNA-binding transcriptional LysR family regulator
MALDLRDLRYFVAVAEEGHVTRAAERLGIEQPPLSMRIKALETQLDVQLFRRKPRGMELTEAGEALFVEATAVLDRLEQAVRKTQSIARGEQGRLRIGIAPTAPFHPFVPRCVRRFRTAFPGVSLVVSEALSDEVRQQLLEQQLDVAFVRVNDMRDERLSTELILEEELIAALPRAHPLARDRASAIESLAALRDDPFVLYGPPGTGIHDQTVGACVAAGFSPKVGQLAPRITSTLGFIGAGMGVSLVPNSTRRVAIDGVVYRAFKSPVPAHVPLAIATRRHDPSPLVRAFVAFVRKLK